jgi:hypothetical protein
MSNDNTRPKLRYTVGYGRPPGYSKFKKGQSGNRQGRPKGSKNLMTLINQALDERVPIIENGKRYWVSKREALAKQLANKAAMGDRKAIQILLKLDDEEKKAEPHFRVIIAKEDANL